MTGGVGMNFLSEKGAGSTVVVRGVREICTGCQAADDCMPAAELREAPHT